MEMSWPERVSRARKQVIALADEEIKRYGHLTWVTEVVVRGKKGLKRLRRLEDGICLKRNVHRSRISKVI